MWYWLTSAWWQITRRLLRTVLVHTCLAMRVDCCSMPASVCWRCYRQLTDIAANAARHIEPPSSSTIVILGLLNFCCLVFSLQFPPITFCGNTCLSSDGTQKFRQYVYIQGGPPKSSLNRTKARFFINFDYKMSIRILYVCCKYSMHDLICDVVSCCVWSCDKILITSWLKTRKIRKYKNQRIFFT